MDRRTLTTLAAAGSAVLLLGALAFQHVAGLPPCEMCIWQRWPHLAAVLIGVVAWLRPSERFWAALGGVAALATAGIGLFHTGVERQWWEGVTSCSGGNIGKLSTGQLLDQIMNAPLVRCDQPAWEMLGLSMASWNAILSLALAGLWFAAFRARG